MESVCGTFCGTFCAFLKFLKKLFNGSTGWFYRAARSGPHPASLSMKWNCQSSRGFATMQTLNIFHCRVRSCQTVIHVTSYILFRLKRPFPYFLVVHATSFRMCDTPECRVQYRYILSYKLLGTGLECQDNLTSVAMYT